MTQGAQGRGHAFQRRQMFRRRHLPRLGQGLRGPGQQRKHLKQFFGVAGWNAAFDVNLGVTIPRQRRQGRGDMGLHPDQRQARRNHPGQGLEPWQTGGGLTPAQRQKMGLRRQRMKEGIRLRLVAALQQQQPMVDPAHQTAARQIRGPARPAAIAMTRDPVPGPILCPFARIDIPDRRQMVQPAKAMRILGGGGVGKTHIPDRHAGLFDHLPRRHEIPGKDLFAARIQPDGARFRLRHKPGCHRRLAGTPHRPTVGNAAGPPRGCAAGLACHECPVAARFRVIPSGNHSARPVTCHPRIAPCACFVRSRCR